MDGPLSEDAQLLHPLAKIQVLEDTLTELLSLQDFDGAVEIRIHQLQLTKILVDYHDFPEYDVGLRHLDLARSYADGGYVPQALQHVEKAKEIQKRQREDGPSSRLMALATITEGLVLLQKGDNMLAEKRFIAAEKLVTTSFGDRSVHLATVSERLGDLMVEKKKYSKALDYTSQAWLVREGLDGGKESEETILLWTRMAEIHFLAGEMDDAIDLQDKAFNRFLKRDIFPNNTINVGLRLAKWLENDDKRALDILRQTEKVALDNFGLEDAKTIEVKRDIALSLLKMEEQDDALKYLNEVEALERQVFGPTSVSLARTLKALGTIHLANHNFPVARDCLQDSLHIFESNPNCQQAVKDVQQKLKLIGRSREPQRAKTTE